MSDTIILLTPSDERLPVDELHELTALEDIAIVRNMDDEIVAYRLEWDDVELTIRFVDIDKEASTIANFLDVTDKLLDGRKDKKAKKIWRRAERMEQVIECEVSPDWDDDRKAQLAVQGVMAYYDYALMFANRTIYNENGNIEVGRESSKPKYWVDETKKDKSDVPNERKKASLQILNRENVPYIKHLPNTPEDHEITLRSKEEIARRAIALYLISRRSDGKPKKWFNKKVEQYGLEDEITEMEQTFNEDNKPDDYILIMFSQRMEAYWTLLWVLGFIDNLSRPDNFANAERAQEILSTRSIDQFILDAKMRPKSEILDALDLHFRYHWAIVDAELYGKKPPTGLLPDVVYQRHYALNWVAQLREQDWDDITTDT